jgi:hypothetical protein
MKVPQRFEELMSRLAEGPLPKDDSIELARLIEQDPALAAELRKQLETSEMIALSENADREGSRFADALRHRLAEQGRKLSQSSEPTTIRTGETSLLNRYSNKQRLIAFMKASIALHLIWVCIAAGAYYVGTQRSADRTTGSGSDLSVNGGLSSGSSILGPEGKGQRNPNGDDQGNAEVSAQGAANIDFQKLAKAATSSNPVERTRAMAQLLEQLNSENAAEILGAMHLAGANPEQMGSLVYAWAALDGPAAMAFADEMKEHMNDEESFGYRSQVIRGWGSADPEAAIAYVDGMEEGRLAGGLRWNLISGLADGNIDVATDYVISRAEAEDRGSWKYSEMLTERVLDQRDVQASVSWADQLPDGNVKTAALHRVATDFVAEDPVAAAEWATALSDTDHGTKVIHEVSDEWAERDPAATVAWLETLPDGDAKAYGMSAALTEWVKRGDPREASEYLAAMPASEQRDRAVGGFARTLSHSDPSSAVTWAETIADPKIRQGALIDAGRSWLRSDPTAAADWMQSGDLEASVVEGISSPGKGDWSEARKR